MEILWIALLAFGGGIASALLGYFESLNVFDKRKFSASVIRALVAAGVFALGYQLVNDITVVDFIAAFIGGAGIDVLGNRAAGAVERNM